MTANDVVRSSEFYVAIVAALLQVGEKFGLIPESASPIIISLATYAAGRILSKTVKAVIPAKEGV